MTVSSPCIDICELTPDQNVCRGCGRTLDEIARWGSMSETERLAIMAGLPNRMQRERAKTGEN
ncbi:MAG: DUF1289 domain-containing protein [Parvibaculaceae bacterium]|nr:DUF1289 domain-containing protein [Parvibaculaceae bacterium]